jgi:hypothetical protein
LHGDHDVLGMSQATKTYEYARAHGVKATLRFVTPEETGAEHCQHDNRQSARSCWPIGSPMPSGSTSAPSPAEREWQAGCHRPRVRSP